MAPHEAYSVSGHGPSREPITLVDCGFAGMLSATAQFPTLCGGSPQIELQIEPSTQLVGGRSFEHTQARFDLSGQVFNGDEESHG
jgi:hypothetical protein